MAINWWSGKFVLQSDNELESGLLDEDTEVRFKDDDDGLIAQLQESKSDHVSAIQLQLQGDPEASSVDDLASHIGDTEPEIQDGDLDEVSQDDPGIHIINSVANLEEGGQFVQHPDGSLQLISAAAFDGQALQLDDESFKSLELTGHATAQGLVAILTG